MRKSRETNKTLGYIVVPLFLERKGGETPEQALERSEFSDVADVLNALQEQDEELIEIIRGLQEAKGRGEVFDPRRLADKISVLGPTIELSRLRSNVFAEVVDRIGVSWDEMFGRLQKYTEREGHCRVPAKHKENGFHLGSWVDRQRQSKDQSTLPEARRQQLDEVGFIWDPHEADWEEGLGHLTTYKGREGHCRVPQSYKENGFRLGQWVSNWRQRKEDLTEARRERLDALSFDWDPSETDWAEGLRYLTIYKEREGHCRVPATHKENGFRLGNWVRVQRRNADTLSAPLRQQLDELGFVWDPYETDWAEGLRYLTIYMEREGNSRVPRLHKENGFRLGQWVDNRRQNKQTLSEARRQQLDELGFDWDPLETDWAECFRYLKIYKEREGHCRVPGSHEEHSFGLGQWVYNQRQRKEELTEARRQQLDELGFDWDPSETDWAEGLRYLTIYKQRKGHCRVPATHKEYGFGLGHWVRVQRRNAGTLSAPRRQQLDELRFVWDPREAHWEEGIRCLKIYKEREGHCRVPLKHIENRFHLGQWVDNWRRNNQTLSETSRQQLAELGFTWGPHEADWEAGLCYLTMYKEREGHCRVPYDHQENGFRLGQWVSTQRGNALFAPQRQQLDELGFVWDPPEADWEEGVRCLKIYKEREGHCRVPLKHIENGFRLGRWVGNRRHRQILSEERRQQLDELGFDWDPYETDWAEGLRYLKIYKEREGHCRVPQKHIENGFCLGQWIGNRRQSQESLPEARRQQLDELGFVWKAR
jgi:hypothetical protein